MMALQFGSTKIGAMQYNGVTIGEAMYNGQIVYTSVPTVAITGTSGNTSRDQFRAACAAYGTTHSTVVTLPFLLDTSQATNLTSMFDGCFALTTVPHMDTSKVTNMDSMFAYCRKISSAPSMDTSKVTNMYSMFYQCRALISVPDMQTGIVTDMYAMFQECLLLTDGNVRLIGKHPSVNTAYMISNSGLTRLPFYNAAGQPI